MPLALTIKDKKAVILKLADEYKRATKKENGRILDTLTKLTSYNCSYAARALR